MNWAARALRSLYETMLLSHWESQPVVLWYPHSGFRTVRIGGGEFAQ
jgi:hypothetical protein